MMKFMGWTKRVSNRKTKPADNVPLDKAGAGAFDRVSNLEKDPNWPTESSSHGGSPTAIKKKLKAAETKNHLPCDVVKGGVSKIEVFARRGLNAMPESKLTRLGEGGFGHVDLIRGKRLTRSSLNEEENPANQDKEVHYACKTLEPDEKKNKPFEKRLREFYNELRGLEAGHGHPNIIQVYDAFIWHKNFFIVMEFAESKTLHKYAERHGPISEFRARTYFQQIGNAVNFLHAQRIAHRDIKLKNILLKKEWDPVSMKQRRVCKLSDMGLSDYFWKDESGPIFLKYVAGTKSSFAPEILEIQVNKDRNNSLIYNAMPADIWALGVCLYEMLCRCLPFNPGTDGHMLALQKNRNFTFKRKSAGSSRKSTGSKRSSKDPLSEDVRHLIRMIFDPDPVSRWTWREISHHKWMLVNPAKQKIITTETRTSVAN